MAWPGKKKREEEMDDEGANGDNEDDEDEKKAVKPLKETDKVQFVEREITLSLINDKLNFIISKLD